MELENTLCQVHPYHRSLRHGCRPFARWSSTHHSGTLRCRIGEDGNHPIYAEASAAYCAIIERLGLGVSEAPVCEVLDEAGNLVARAAYNGRIFAVGPDGECDYARVLHETCGT